MASINKAQPSPILSLEGFSPSSVSSASTPGGPGEDVMKSMEFHWESLGMIGEGVMKSLWIIGLSLDLRI